MVSVSRVREVPALVNRNHPMSFFGDWDVQGSGAVDAGRDDDDDIHVV